MPRSRGGLVAIGQSYEATIVISSIGEEDEFSLAHARRTIERYARAQCEANEEWLREHPEFPDIYALDEYGEPRVRYHDDGGMRCYRTDTGGETCWRVESKWSDPPEIVRVGTATCFSLSTWCAAQRRLEGLLATPQVWLVDRDQHEHRYHVVTAIARPWGIEIEDASERLGMHVPIHRGRLSSSMVAGYHYCAGRGWHAVHEHVHESGGS